MKQHKVTKHRPEAKNPRVDKPEVPRNTGKYLKRSPPPKALLGAPRRCRESQCGSLKPRDGAKEPGSMGWTKELGWTTSFLVNNWRRNRALAGMYGARHLAHYQLSSSKYTHPPSYGETTATTSPPGTTIAATTNSSTTSDPPRWAPPGTLEGRNGPRVRRTGGEVLGMSLVWGMGVV